MTIEKNLGICMDHANAHLIEYTANPMETKTIADPFNNEERQDSIRKSESLMHNKEQHEEAGYYKALAEVIKNYTHVLLFGPTEAKVELHNILSVDHLFDKIKIEVQSTDKMTENQQHAFVKEYFSQHQK